MATFGSHNRSQNFSDFFPTTRPAPPTWRRHGTHHGVSHQHLQAYLNEFTFRFNRRFYPFNAFRSLLGIAGGVTAPTYAELYSGVWKHPTSWGCG